MHHCTVLERLPLLLDRFRTGALVLPEHRLGGGSSTVWGFSATRALLHSVRDGFPLGEVLLWRTTEALEVADDPRVPRPPPLPFNAGGRGRRVVLDGVERLAALAGALRFPYDADWSHIPSDATQVWWYQGQFYAGHGAALPDAVALTDPEGLEALPLSSLLCPIEFHRATSRAAGRSDEVVRELVRLQRAFSDCKLVITEVLGSREEVEALMRRRRGV